MNCHIFKPLSAPLENIPVQDNSRSLHLLAHWLPQSGPRTHRTGSQKNRGPWPTRKSPVSRYMEKSRANRCLTRLETRNHRQNERRVVLRRRFAFVTILSGVPCFFIKFIEFLRTCVARARAQGAPESARGHDSINVTRDLHRGLGKCRDCRSIGRDAHA